MYYIMFQNKINSDEPFDDSNRIAVHEGTFTHKPMASMRTVNENKHMADITPCKNVN